MAQLNGKKPLLDLETLDPSPQHIRIDGEDYRLCSLNSMGLRDVYALQQAGQALGDFRGTDDATDEQMEILEERLDRAIHVALPDVPDAVFARLSFVQKLAVSNAFLASSSLLTVPAPTVGKAKSRTGAS